MPTANENGYVQRIDAAAEGAAMPLRAPVGRGPFGQLVVRARIGRAGLLQYPQRREFRPETAAFDERSLRTLDGVPIVLAKDHRDLHKSQAWREKSVGHVTGPARDGDFIVANLHVHDAATIAAIERGDLTEISAGYLCGLEEEPGEHNGEPYDCVQRDIRYNHVALLPPGAARAGREVRILREELPDDDSDRFDADRSRSDADDALERQIARARAVRDHNAANAWRSRSDGTTARKLSRFTVPLGKIDEATRSVPILASTPAPVDGEALVSWDLSRFIKNPVILWGHDASALPIARAEDVQVTPEGLAMRVFFASERANPLAALVWESVCEGTVRAVSVGFEPGLATKRPDGAIERADNVLLEVSFVSIGKDEDAGTPALTEEDTARANQRFISTDPETGEPDYGDERVDATDEALLARVDRARRERDTRAANAWTTTNHRTEKN